MIMHSIVGFAIYCYLSAMFNFCHFVMNVLQNDVTSTDCSQKVFNWRNQNTNILCCERQHLHYQSRLKSEIPFNKNVLIVNGSGLSINIRYSVALCNRNISQVLNIRIMTIFCVLLAKKSKTKTKICYTFCPQFIIIASIAFPELH